MHTENRRALVFLLYDPDGICDRSVLDTLHGFRPHVESILVVVNGALQPDSLAAVQEVADRVLERPNVGYDVGAYRDALARLGWDHIRNLDELLLVNYTFFGPVESFAPTLDRMAEEDIDFWGITDHPSVTPHPYKGRGTMPTHLQSYWLAVRGRLLRDPAFEHYWRDLPDPTSYSEVVSIFECQFTEHFSNLGFSWKAAFPADNYGVANTTMEAPLALLQDGCPLFKKRLYFHDVPALVDQGIVTAAVTQEAVRLGYSEDLIVEGVVRRATTRELAEGMGASYIQVPGMADDVASESSRLTVRMVSADSKPWKTLANEGVASLMGDADVLLIAPRPPKPGLRADGIHLRYRGASDAITANPLFITGLFADHALLGAVYPYIQVVGTAVRGRKWFSDSLLAKSLAVELGLPGRFSQTSPVAPYRGAAAYRRELVDLVAAAIEHGGGWERLVELVGDESLLHSILDLLTGDVARSGGYFVAETGTLAEAQMSMLLFVDLYSHTPKVFREYTHYPYTGRVIAPTLKNRVGKALQNVSPNAFDRVHDLELQARSALGGLRKAKK